MMNSSLPMEQFAFSKRSLEVDDEIAFPSCAWSDSHFSSAPESGIYDNWILDLYGVDTINSDENNGLTTTYHHPFSPEHMKETLLLGSPMITSSSQESGLSPPFDLLPVNVEVEDNLTTTSSAWHKLLTNSCSTDDHAGALRSTKLGATDAARAKASDLKSPLQSSASIDLWWRSYKNFKKSDAKEMKYREAILRRPLSLGVLEPAEAAGKQPKRRNVRISSDPQTSAARRRRERISGRLRLLQRLVPGGDKLDTASMLDEAANYLKFLKSQIRTLGDSTSSSHTFLC